MDNKKKYISPEVEEIICMIVSPILSNEHGEEGDEHGWS